MQLTHDPSFPCWLYLTLKSFLWQDRHSIPITTVYYIVQRSRGGFYLQTASKATVIAGVAGSFLIYSCLMPCASEWRGGLAWQSSVRYHLHGHSSSRAESFRG
jgi:hypothetical protein